jgi:hypothetical protein
VGAGVIVTVLFEVTTDAQGEFGLAVNVSVTLPDEISAVPGA